MKIHIYTNAAYDTVALINDDGDTVVSLWDAKSRGFIGNPKTALEDALETTDVSDWDDQGREIDVDEFNTSDDLFLVIREDGEWDVQDRDLLVSRLSFHLGERHPIVRALNA